LRPPVPTILGLSPLDFAFCTLVSFGTHQAASFSIYIESYIRGRMKNSILILGVVLVVLVAFAGAALAMEMSGSVTAVDAQKGMLKIKNENIEVGFDCEKGSLIKNVKAGDHVTVEYTEAAGKKKATKVTPMMMKKTAPVGC